MNLPSVCQQESQVSGEPRPDLCPLSLGQYVLPTRDRTQDAGLFYFRTVIEYAEGDEEKSKDYYQVLKLSFSEEYPPFLSGLGRSLDL